MSAVSPLDVGRRIIALLDLKEDELFEIARTRDGRLIVSRAKAT